MCSFFSEILLFFNTYAYSTFALKSPLIYLSANTRVPPRQVYVVGEKQKAECGVCTLKCGRSALTCSQGDKKAPALARSTAPAAACRLRRPG
jgi:hypothetical protein